MSLFPSSTASSTTTNTQGDLSQDVQVKDPPSDSTSDLAFHPKANFLAVSSWDQKVRIYEIEQSGNSVGKAMFDFQGPALGVCWSPVSLHLLLLR